MCAFNEDWIRKYKGASRVALKPKTTAQVSQVLAHCNERRLAVVPQGGNTGLVGGSVPVFDEVVLSTSNMNSILDVDEAAGVVVRARRLGFAVSLLRADLRAIFILPPQVAQAGVVLERLDNVLAEHGLCVPLDLGAKGSCQIGARQQAALRASRPDERPPRSPLCRWQRLHKRGRPSPAALRLAARFGARSGGGACGRQRARLAPQTAQRFAVSRTALVLAALLTPSRNRQYWLRSQAAVHWR